jgi:hypothetical protein
VLDEVEHPAPGVLGVGGELLLLTVEEAVGRVAVDDHLGEHVVELERTIEPLDVLDGDPRIRTAHQRQDRRVHLSRPLCRTGRAVSSRPGSAVEADRPGQVVTRGGCQPRVATTEAEAEREDRVAAHGA